MVQFTEVEVAVSEQKANSSAIEKDVNRRVAKIIELSKQYDYLNNGKSYDAAHMTLVKLISSCANLLSYVKDHAVYTGQASCIKEHVDEVVDCKIYEEDDKYHIVFDKLLPKREKRYDVETQMFLMPYVHAIHKAAKEAKLLPLNERVAVVFLHHFKDEHSMIDYDNFEIKAIVDAIAVNYLPDDSPKWCTYYMDYRYADEPYTEIIVMPQSKFISWIITKKGPNT